MKKYSRLFTFGCSLTGYMYPTWVDFLALNPTFTKVYNYGRPGAGNKYILGSLLDAISRFDLGQNNDHVAVMFTSCVRHDFIGYGGEFRTGGNFFNNPELSKDLSPLDQPWSPHTGIWDSWLSISSFLKIIETLPMVTLLPVMNGFSKDYSVLETAEPLIEPPDHAAFDKSIFYQRYKRLVPDTNFSEFYTHVARYEPYTYGPLEGVDNGWTDGHPTISAHCAWLAHALPEWFDLSYWEKADQWESEIIRSDRNAVSSRYADMISKQDKIVRMYNIDTIR